MGARELLAELAEQGFSVHADGGHLLIRPASALTDELRGRLRARKADLIDALQTPIESGNPPPLMARLVRWGWNKDEAKGLAGRIAERDPSDNRRTCVECSAYQPGRCRNPRAAGLCGPLIGRDWAALNQRCTAFQNRG